MHIHIKRTRLGVTWNLTGRNWGIGGWNKMKQNDVIETLEHLVSVEEAALERSLGVERGAVVLEVSSTEPRRAARVVTPGDRFFFVEIDGNFSHNQFEEDLSDDDVREILRAYYRVAVFYVLNGARASGGRVAPTRIVSVDGVEYTLTSTIKSMLRRLLSGGFE